MMIPTATAITTTTTTMAEGQQHQITTTSVTQPDAPVTMNKHSNENNSNTNHCTICSGSNSNSNDSNTIMNGDGSNYINNNNNSDNEKGNKQQYYVIWQSCSVLFEFILSVSLSFLCKPIIGSIYIVRTLLFGYILKYAVTTATKTTTTTTRTSTCTAGTSSKEQSIDLWSNKVVTPASSTTICGVHPNQTSNSNCRCSLTSSSSTASWPPPTLIGLAMLTIMAFIVHPDGYTWTLIRKIRDVMYLLAKSLSVCWTMAVNDYGSIISTLLALSTFVALFFVCYILHETLKSRTNQCRSHQQHNNPNKRSEKHGGKRRKRKNTHHATRVVVPTNQKGKLSGVTNDCDSNADGTFDTAIPSQETDVAQTQLIPQQQHLLPPLAEDEPLDTPTATEHVLCVSLWNQQSHHSAPSPRSRTASSSTADSILCSSVDDQSSCCSGRSTPTPISANECTHLSFDTTTTTLPQNKILPTINSTEPNNNTNHSVRSTPNRTMNPNSRRSQNARHRNGKKNSPYNNADNNETTGTNNTNAITTPPRPTPSKRWDALKPSNRVGNSNSNSHSNNNNNSQHHFNSSRHQHQHHRHHQGYQQTKNNYISSSVPIVSTFSHEDATNRKQSTKEELTIAIAAPPVNTFTADLELTEVTMSSITAIGNYDVVRQHTSNDIILDVPQTTAYTDHHDTLFRSSEITNNEVPPVSGLNPNSPVWTGTYNVVQQHIGAPLSHGSSPLTLGVSGTSSASSYLDYNASNYPSTSSATNDSPMRSINFSHLYASEPYQPAQSHYFNGPTSYNHSREIFQDPEPTDYSFIRSLQEDTHYKKNEHDTVPSVYSSMLPPSSTLTATSSSSTISSSYHRTSQQQQQHAIVRENPFANNSDYDDIDDDQIEAELLELGGQMVGSILDF